MSSLNDLVTGCPGTLVKAGDINDRGELTGAASSNAASVAQVAAPPGRW